MSHVHFRLMTLAILMSVAAGCATATVSGKFPSTPPTTPGAMHVFVMPAGSTRNPATGNEGVSFIDAQRLVDEQLLAVAREKDPQAALAEVEGTAPYRPMEPYIAAAGQTRVTPGELNAAGYARAHGGTHLLVPTIVEWRQMRSDDPVGAFIEAHNRIVVELRLVRLDPVATEGDVTFTNHARTTFNQSANGLLDSQFRKVVEKLLGS